MENPIIKIFSSLSDDRLIRCILELQDKNGVIAMDSEFRGVGEEVRHITQSTAYSTDLLMCQMNILREGALRFFDMMDVE